MRALILAVGIVLALAALAASTFARVSGRDSSRARAVSGALTLAALAAAPAACSPAATMTTTRAPRRKRRPRRRGSNTPSPRRQRLRPNGCAPGGRRLGQPQRPAAAPDVLRGPRRQSVHRRRRGCLVDLRAGRRHRVLRDPRALPRPAGLAAPGRSAGRGVHQQPAAGLPGRRGRPRAAPRRRAFAVRGGGLRAAASWREQPRAADRAWSRLADLRRRRVGLDGGRQPDRRGQGRHRRTRRNDDRAGPRRHRHLRRRGQPRQRLRGRRSPSGDRDRRARAPHGRQHVRRGRTAPGLRSGRRRA